MQNYDQENKIYDTKTLQESSLQPKSWSWLVFVLIAIPIMVLLRMFVVEPYIVSGISMYPNYKDRDYLIVNKITPRAHHPIRGDQIIFRYPKNPNEIFIKRVIGLPGEKVQILNGKVKIFNSQWPEGKVLDETYLADTVITTGAETVTTIGQNEYFVMGDNRGASSDSRSWGLLPRQDLIGRVVVRVFPLKNFMTPETVQYR